MRRRLLMAGGAVWASAGVAGTARAAVAERRNYLVIGAGLAGLAAAQALQQATALGQGLGLAQLGAAESGRPGGDLEPGYVDALVGLGVGPQR